MVARHTVQRIGVLVLLLPLAQAAEMTTDVDSVEVVPETGQAVVDLTLTLSCDEYLQAGGGPEGLEIPVTPSPAHRELVVEGPGMVLVMGNGCTDASILSASGNATYVVSATRDAPGLTPLTTKFDGDVPTAPTGETQSVSTDLEVLVRPYIACS